MTIIADIPKTKLASIQKKIKKAADQAVRVGLPDPRIQILSEFNEPLEVYDGLARIRGSGSNSRIVPIPMVKIELSNFLPTMGKWEFVGHRQLVTQGKQSKIYTFSSENVPINIFNRDGLCCEHCAYQRNRKTSWLIKDTDTHQIAEIGTSCIESYTGYGNGSKLLGGMNDLSRLINELIVTSRDRLVANGLDELEEVRSVLAVAYREIHESGFVSSAESDAQNDLGPTWKKVYERLVQFRDPSVGEESITVTAADFLTAEEIADYYQNSAPTNFCLAVNKAIEKGLSDVRDVAVLCAAVNSYIEFKKRQAKQLDTKSLAKSSEYLSEPKERIDFIGKIFRMRQYPGAYQMITYVTMFDEDMNLIRWRASGSPDIKVGQAYAMKGTVKTHRVCNVGAFEGCNETVLTRISVKDELGPALFSAPDTTQSSVEDDEALDQIFSVMGL